jgi:hypothetical protein
MITCQLEAVEIDYCVDCGGIWLDSGELELLLEDNRKAVEIMETFEIDSKSIEEKRKCPICDRKMQKIRTSQKQNAPLIDKCRKNHGLWFDKNELKELIASAEGDSEKKIVNLLENMFSS